MNQDLVICYECQRIMIDGEPEPLVGISSAEEAKLEAIFQRNGLKKKAR